MWRVTGCDGKMVELVVGVTVYVAVVGMVVGAHGADRHNVSEFWKNRCPLEAGSLNPWLVKIWDVDYGLIMAHGSIIADRVVLSTCSPFIDADLRLSQYLLVSQTVHDLNAPGKRCIQTKKAQQLFRHPKCTRNYVINDQLWSTNFVDLALWITEGRYETTGTFPIMKVINDWDTFLSSVRKIEADPTKAACNLPVYSSRRRIDAYFPRDTKSTLIPYGKECLQIICKDSAKYEDCRKSNRTLFEGSRLCVVPGWKKQAPTYGEPGTNWYSGSPLVCDGTGYGMSTYSVSRSPDEPDVHVIASFIERTSWIAKTIDKMETLPPKEDHEEDHEEELGHDKEGDQEDEKETGTKRETKERKSSGAAHSYGRLVSAKFFIFAVTSSYFLQC